MRHTFVSVLSANGVPVESIALLAGHDRIATTESVYRHEIRPALTQGAEVMTGRSRAMVVENSTCLTDSCQR
jgi:site-specific recombinase XerD